MSRMQTFALSHAETTALHVALTGHDVDLESHICNCGERSHNESERTEHLIETAFRAGECHAIMQK